MVGASSSCSPSERIMALRLVLTRPLCLTLIDQHIISPPHPHMGRSNPSTALQHQYKKQQQQDHVSDFRWKRLADDGRRTKMRREIETTQSYNNDSNGTNSNSTFSSLHKQPQFNGRGEGRCRGRSPWTGFDPQTDDKLYKSFVRSPSLPRRRPVNEKRVVNWRLACFMANEYLNHGTLLGRQWPPQDSNPKCRHEKNDKSEPSSGSPDQDGGESKREKEKLYDTLTDFLRSGDVHFPGIMNPSQMATWLGLN